MAIYSFPKFVFYQRYDDYSQFRYKVIFVVESLWIEKNHSIYYCLNFALQCARAKGKDARVWK